MTAPAQRTLVVVRHATAEPYAASDHERALTARGHAQARALGAWLAAEGLAPDVAIVSTAVRTQQTWAGVVAGGGFTVEPIVDGAIYAGDTDSVLEAVHVADAEARTVLVLGHNPTVATLALELDDGGGDPGLLVEVSGGFPPASAAVLTTTRDWADLATGGATLSALSIRH
ncbi:SixA phosphatase family protein [Nocardioides massiliensis]|uniref:Phosphohistidine phosphatase n=1 Tax=Nocardioides massiliensis TaxID=1325935 RepID=A0ABT9NRN1_9ACTN|nr:histidine phosphatase family protein [Nocardioides massiliensis]MDP9823090.1 phosphohistidine phosphatase [Nocardioides massiliensis]